MLMVGGRMAVTSGATDLAIPGRCMPRRTESTNWAHPHKLKLLCNPRLSAIRALQNESAHEDASHTGLNVEASKRYDPAVAYVSDDAIVVNNNDAIVGNNDGVHLSEQVFAFGSDKQDTDITKEVTSRKQTLEKHSNMQYVDIANNAPRKTVEEAFGLLKEQVEADRRIELASKQGVEADSSPDMAKPLKRSKILAKQVISQSSARAIGFVSQLWVSASLFKVIALEVRPSLLSGEIDRVFLGDICQIGDVVLVTDESALENETTALDCETLVGYDVVTEDGKYIGKIRDYSFDLDDGKLTSLDFDSVGFSLVPSSLISTYRLDVEEVIEVLPDSILVKDGAESRIRRLTKGFWQLPAGGEKRRSQKMARSRMLKKTLVEGDDVVSVSRQLPPNMRPRFFEGSEFEGLDERAEPAERRSFRKNYGGSRPRYKNR